MRTWINQKLWRQLTFLFLIAFIVSNIFDLYVFPPEGLSIQQTVLKSLIFAAFMTVGYFLVNHFRKDKK